VASANKQKGSQFERDVVQYLRDHGFNAVERRYGAGAHEDKGDIDGVPDFAIECKNQRQINLAEFIEEALIEAKHAGRRFGAAIVKRRQRNVKDAYVVMSLEQFVELLQR
jgi:Holliday junction resolvase